LRQTIQQLPSDQVLLEMPTPIDRERRKTAYLELSVPFALDETEHYFADLSRNDAERVLSGSVDAFLVRASSIDGCFALSKYAAQKKAFIHWVIAPTDGGYYLKGKCAMDVLLHPSHSSLFCRLCG
jgi:hypothetical protein